MNWLRIVVGIYGLVNIAGGIAGFLSAKSTMSLLTGGTSGLILVLCMIMVPKSPGMAWRTAGLVTFLLLCFWTYRAATNGFPMMATGNLVLAATVLALMVYSHFSATKKAAAL